MADRRAGKIVTVVVLFSIVLLFAFGIWNLFMLRFSTGDVYPAYSSLRSDPLGAKVLYESLNNLRDVSTDRNYQPLPELGPEGNTTFFLIGLPMSSLQAVDRREAEMLELFVSHGGRLVLTFHPEGKGNTSGQKDEKSGKADGPAKGKRRCSDRRSGGCGAPLVSLEDRWGFHTAYDEKLLQPSEVNEKQAAGNAGASGEEKKVVNSTLATDDPSLPASMSWHSPWYLNVKNEGWRSVYTLKDRPVVIERTLGKGTVVIATDSYALSNEAMLRERNPGFLLWLTGKKERIVFDETHSGIQEAPGMAALARKYRLHGLLAGFLLLAVLYIWRNSVSLVPPYESGRKSEDAALGRNHLSGLVNLLRSNIKADNVLAICLEEWKKTFGNRPGRPGNRLKEAEALLEAEKKMPLKKRRPVEVYNEICILLQRGNRNER